MGLCRIGEFDNHAAVERAVCCVNPLTDHPDLPGAMSLLLPSIDHIAVVATIGCGNVISFWVSATTPSVLPGR